MHHCKYSSTTILFQNLEDGSIEERIFVNGQKSGGAVLKFVNGDFYELNYVDNILNGDAKYFHSSQLHKK